MDPLSQPKAFKLPCAKQDSSRLLQLPRELRVTILRMLMRSADPLYSAKEFLPYNPWRAYPCNDPLYKTKVTSLSAQLLSCCQQINAEAFHILYKENTLSIHVSWVFSIAILDHEFSLSRIPNLLAGQVVLDELTSENILEAANRLQKDILPAIKFFDKLLLHIAPAICDNVFIGVHMLQPFLEGKHVTVKNEIKLPTRDSMPTDHIRRDNALFRPLAYLRGLKSLSFDPPMPTPYPLPYITLASARSMSGVEENHPEPVTAEKLIQLVTSDPVSEPLPTLLNTLRMIDHHVGSWRYSLQRELEGGLHRTNDVRWFLRRYPSILDAVYKYHAHEFTRVKRLLLEDLRRFQIEFWIPAQTETDGRNTHRAAYVQETIQFLLDTDP